MSSTRIPRTNRTEAIRYVMYLFGLTAEIFSEKLMQIDSLLEFNIPYKGVTYKVQDFCKDQPVFTKHMFDSLELALVHCTACDVFGRKTLPQDLKDSYESILHKEKYALRFESDGAGVRHVRNAVELKLKKALAASQQADLYQILTCVVSAMTMLDYTCLNTIRERIPRVIKTCQAK